MSDIARWLSGLGLEKYVSAFSEAEIELIDLPHLTVEDFKELGLPIGPRRRIQQAAKQLDGPADCAIVEAPAAARSSDRSEAARTPSAAERRQLTVMFVDLVGSTEMATRLDAEDVREVITRYQNTVAGVVSRHDGFVARYMGDGVLCYFGWPRANEDDAERAVRAGLEIIAEVKKSASPADIDLATRVGIATGVVIVGDLIGTGAAQEAAVVGETPNLAARLQGLAMPDQLIVAPETRSLLGNLFEVDRLGEQRLKGIAQAVNVFAVVGEQARESRFDAHHADVLTPIVGREQELGLVRECWASAKAGSGQMVVVCGEAGIGKSRIIRAAIDEFAQDAHVRVTFQCSPYHTDSALYPVIARLTYVAGIAQADSNGERLAKLEALAEINADNIVLMATLLGIDSGERHAPLKLTPAQLRAQTIQCLVDMLVQHARDRPLLAVFEDLHWIDPTTLEVLDVALGAIGEHKMLVLATARPTFEHQFGGHPAVTRFTLNRLGTEQTLLIIRKLTGGKPVPDAVVELIVGRTDGVPLFVEELTKAILESGALKDDGEQLLLHGPLDLLAIPSTLHDSLMARLDRLQPIKEVAQTAACIGREFDHRLLASISPLPETELAGALDGLIKAELIYRRGLPPEATYLFKHALVRDAAHESLLKERRGQVHARILMALERQPDVAPEVLANHAEAAGLTERAIDLFEAASKRAIARPAYDEGISHLEHAIGLVSPRLETGDRALLERALSLQVQLGIASLTRWGYQAERTLSAFLYAQALVDRIGDTHMRFPVLYGLWVSMYVRGEHAQALRQAQALVHLAQNADETAPRVVAHRVAGLCLSLQGDFAGAQTHLDTAFGLYDPSMHAGLEDRFGQDVGAAVHVYLAINLTLIGQTRRGEKHAQEAERNAIATGHANTICYACTHLILLALLRQDDREFERINSLLVPLAIEHDLALWLSYAALFRELVGAGDGAEFDIGCYLQADAAYVAGNSKLYLPQIRVAAGWRALRLGLPGPAGELASMAHELIAETGETQVLSDLHRLEAALAMANDDVETAETNLTTAIALARKQGAKMWELRAAVDLAKLWHASGRAPEAEGLLGPLIDNVADGDCDGDRTRALTFVSNGSQPADCR